MNRKNILVETRRGASLPIKIGNITIGKGHPLAVQSMTKTTTSDVGATVKQIKQLEKAGCQIVRCAVVNEKDAAAIKQIKKRISIPLVADIHFNYRLAILAAEAGADKLRINPGNIGSQEKIASVVAAAKERNIPIRVGANSGSLAGRDLVGSVIDNVRILEKLGFHNIVVAAKSTSVPDTLAAYRALAKKLPYPLHVGLTEAGIPEVGVVRSAVGIGALLAEGIGDTIRVSLTADPVEEVRVGYEILQSLDLVGDAHVRPLIISCPTCGRAHIDVQKIATDIYNKLNSVGDAHVRPLTIAIMGCEVNGPGEAAHADIGLAGGKGVGFIFKKGKIIKKINVGAGLVPAHCSIKLTHALWREIRRKS